MAQQTNTIYMLSNISGVMLSIELKETDPNTGRPKTLSLFRDTKNLRVSETVFNDPKVQKHIEKKRIRPFIKRQTVQVS